MTFGKWLASKRDAAELTQGQLATKVGVSVSYISALERDEPNSKDGSPRRPKLDKVDALAKALNAESSEARLAAGYAPSEPEDRFKLPDGVMVSFESTSHLTDEQKDKIVNVIRTLVAGVRAEND